MWAHLYASFLLPAGLLPAPGASERALRVGVRLRDLLTPTVFYLNSSIPEPAGSVGRELEYTSSGLQVPHSCWEEAMRVLIQGSDCLDSVRAAAGLVAN